MKSTWITFTSLPKNLKLMGLKDTKIRLSNDELSFLKDTLFFEKKRSVISAIINLFGELEDSMNDVTLRFNSIIPEEALSKRGKISRGENYLGFPYVILDYPAVFSKEGIFAFRSLMWWGNPFSFTFHISGSYLSLFKSKLATGLTLNDYKGLLVCINDYPFEHHLGSSNYKPLKEFLLEGGNVSDLIQNYGFLKITIPLPIDEIDQINIVGPDFLEYVSNLLK